MKKSIIAGFACVCMLMSCSKNEEMAVTYPDTRTEDVSDNYFGTEVKDPYRWLEIDTATEVEAWAHDHI